MRGTRPSWPLPLRAQGTMPALGIRSVELAGPDSSLLCSLLPRASSCVDVAGDGWDLKVLVALPGPWLGCSSSKSQPSWLWGTEPHGDERLGRATLCPLAWLLAFALSVVPLLSLQGTLEGLEEELLAFFSVTPHSVYTALMDNRYRTPRGIAAPGMWLGAPLVQGTRQRDEPRPGASPCGDLWLFVPPLPSWAPWDNLGQDNAGVRHISSNPIPHLPQLRATPAPRTLPVHGPRVCQ